MGLLNHLFGSKKCVAKELAMDDKKRMELWEQHLSNYSTREGTSRLFFSKFRGYPNLDAVDQLLNEIESTILLEFININEENKIDEEIISDLNRLKDFGQIQDLLTVLKTVRHKQEAILTLFKEIHDVLKVELHLIKFIKQRPPNVEDLLHKLSTVIYNEGLLYHAFSKRYIEDKPLEKITWLARAVILERELKDRVYTAEEKFANKLAKDMEPDESYESKKSYRVLGEKIYLTLAKIAVGGDLPAERDTDIAKAVMMMTHLMKDDSLMYKIVKKLRPKFDDAKIKIIILVFKNAFDLGHFDDLASEFVT